MSRSRSRSRILGDPRNGMYTLPTVLTHCWLFCAVGGQRGLYDGWQRDNITTEVNTYGLDFLLRGR
jgi:hypothetical protein